MPISCRCCVSQRKASASPPALATPHRALSHTFHELSFEDSSQPGTPGGCGRKMDECKLDDFMLAEFEFQVDHSQIGGDEYRSFLDRTIHDSRAAMCHVLTAGSQTGQ